MAELGVVERGGLNNEKAGERMGNNNLNMDSVVA